MCNRSGRELAAVAGLRKVRDAEVVRVRGVSVDIGCFSSVHRGEIEMTEPDDNGLSGKSLVRIVTAGRWFDWFDVPCGNTGRENRYGCACVEDIRLGAGRSGVSSPISSWPLYIHLRIRDHISSRTITKTSTTPPIIPPAIAGIFDEDDAPCAADIPVAPGEERIVIVLIDGPGLGVGVDTDVGNGLAAEMGFISISASIAMKVTSGCPCG